MTILLGVDCATQPHKTGLAMGELRDGVTYITRCALGSKTSPPAAIALDWLAGCDDVLLAFDSPLGWPEPLGGALRGHRAGDRLSAGSDALFRRAADVDIKNRLGKLPLEVAASWLARTAVAALVLLDEIREGSGLPVPLAWEPCEAEPWRVIEVYPAATRIAHGAPSGSGSIAGLAGVLDCSAVASIVAGSRKDAGDACVCALAGADFLAGRAVPPVDLSTAKSEGWIWAPEVARSVDAPQEPPEPRRRQHAEKASPSSGEASCLACASGMPSTGPRKCPVCGHVFAGGKWTGIDGHWKAHHRDVMEYSDFWGSLCSGHRGGPCRPCGKAESSAMPPR